MRLRPTASVLRRIISAPILVGGLPNRDVLSVRRIVTGLPSLSKHMTLTFLLYRYDVPICFMHTHMKLLREGD